MGPVQIGGDNPMRIQSMTTTNTNDTDACVEQAIRIIEAGGELVRLTTQGIREAENLKNIKAALVEKGYQTPLVADVHFNPHVADVAALYADKVRINPGNYVDPARTFKHLEYTDEEYAQELRKIDERFVPFLNICKEHHTAIRIGVNHGSLSDRIMSRYGDTPAGIVESCMEFLRICKREQFDNVVISIKASNTVVMVESVRLLVKEMDKEDIHYPLHLGVTEAGEGEDGRIKSAVGIGTLLKEGIGDTIRVSLSEPPENEIPVARQLADYAQRHLEGKEQGIECFEMDESHLQNDLIAVAPAAQNRQQPIIATRTYHHSLAEKQQLQLEAAVDFGSMLIDQQIDGVWIQNEGDIPDDVLRDTAYALLQATRRRITKTEYISCPGCGRTLYDLTSTIARIKAATKDMVGLKIAVMGCIVNGPGEMADADYGYVGAGPGKISLYKNKVCVEKNIPESEAVEHLLQLISADQKA